MDFTTLNSITGGDSQKNPPKSTEEVVKDPFGKTTVLGKSAEDRPRKLSGAAKRKLKKARGNSVPGKKCSPNSEGVKSRPQRWGGLVPAYQGLRRDICRTLLSHHIPSKDQQKNRRVLKRNPGLLKMFFRQSGWQQPPWIIRKHAYQMSRRRSSRAI